MSVNHLSDQLTLTSNAGLSCRLKNRAIAAKVSAPSAAGWNPPDYVTQTSAALHVYTSPPFLFLRPSICPFISFLLSSLLQGESKEKSKELAHSWDLRVHYLSFLFWFWCSFHAWKAKNLMQLFTYSALNANLYYTRFFVCNNIYVFSLLFFMLLCVSIW